MKTCAPLLLLLLLVGAVLNGAAETPDSCDSSGLECDQKSSVESSLWRGELPAASGSEESIQLQEENQTKGPVSGIKPTPDALRLVLVGKTGTGKSSIGNTILGRKAFVAKAGDKSITKNCSKAEAEVDGRHVMVVDTPGLFDTSLSNKEIIRETYKSVSLLAPGPHAFLLVVQIGRFTEEEKRVVEYIKAAFGEKAEKYIIVLFTRGDDLEEDETTIEDYIKDADPALKELISSCGNRFHVFNNREKKERAQVTKLLQKIDHMVEENGGSYYTNDMLREAEEAIQKETERILKKKEEEMRREEEKIKRKYQEEMEKLLQMEKPKQEEEIRQMKEQLKNKEEQMKRQQEQQQKKEEEYKERERILKEEIKEMKRKYEELARRQAEQSNPFLKQVLSELAKIVVKGIVDFFLKRWS